MSLCKYKHVLGEEGKGFHSVRILNIAILDLLATVLGSWLISYYFKLNFFIVLITALIIGVLLHRLFCVNTTINKMIFGTI